MIVYSEKIIAFIQEIKRLVRTILSQEIGVKVTSNRFCDFKQRHTYPIVVVLFNNKSMLGYFDPQFYELGFHECLMHAGKEQLHAVVRHELAHYFTHILHGETAEPHGREFQAFCRQMGWAEEVARATICLEGQGETAPIQESAILRKIQKLMALATSHNSHEAEMAMLKSQQLLLKHNLDSKYISSQEEEKVFLKRVMGQKKESAKMRAIGKILETFFVSIVYSRGKDLTYLEILGSAVNLEIAEHVASVLEVEFERLWKTAQREKRLKGQIAKNSLFLGIAKGYCQKVEALKRDYSPEICKGLMVIEKQLTHAKSMAYPRLSSHTSQARFCPSSSALGEKMGRELNIRSSLRSESLHIKLLK